MDRGDEDLLQLLEERLGYRFRDRALLEEALTHRSWANDQGIDRDWERLEFLGDAVLGMLAGEWLFRRFAEHREGELSRLKAFLVSEPALADVASTRGLGESLRLSVGEERSGGRERPTILADALEAVLAAIYLDAGLETVRRIVEPILEMGLTRWQREESLRDAKTALQELTQARGWDLPWYRQTAVEGPDHARTFTIEVWIEGELAGAGRASSKKAAQQEAAREALARLADA
ncbi:MAG: ribonuclease III [Thermoanaerobaculia bacterium]